MLELDHDNAPAAAVEALWTEYEHLDEMLADAAPTYPRDATDEDE